jgi:hypothetical protein
MVTLEYDDLSMAFDFVSYAGLIVRQRAADSGWCNRKPPRLKPDVSQTPDH